MKYCFHEGEEKLSVRICQLNGLSIADLDVSAFNPDYDLKILRDFKDKLLSYADKRFFIVGDYDCDGICATAIMKRLFDDLGIKANYYIPSRIREGYGLNDTIVKTAYDNGFDVLLCVDNGIAAVKQLEYASSLGLKTLIIDHHEFVEMPSVDGILHPCLFEKEYEDMCAAGLCALLSNSFRYDELTLVYGGMATLADMVRVLGYNRWLMKKAISILNEKTIYPISYLLKKKEVDFTALSYDVIPKLNAVSRLDDMLNVNYVVRYLLDDSPSCMAYLNKIEEINTVRKQLTNEMSSMAERLADESQDIIVVASEAFKEGLCGLIANRLLGIYGKPVIVFALSDGLYKGSGRGPKGFDLYSHLAKRNELYASFGGHAQAVGLSIKEEDLEAFKEYLANEPCVYEEGVKDVLVIDEEDIDLELLKEMKKLEPFGTGFGQPLFALKDVKIKNSFAIKGLYPKYVISDKLEAISFNSSFLNRKFTTMIGQLRKDDYHRDRISFIIEDLL